MRLETRVYNVVYRVTWEPQVAHELVQEAFVRLWHMRDRVRVDTVEPLLFRIALNLARKRRRWLRLRRFVGLGERAHEGPLPDVRLLGEERAHRVREAVQALPEKQRQVILLCELGQLTYAQAAESLGIPAGTVASRRHHALKTLRHHLEASDG